MHLSDSAQDVDLTPYELEDRDTLTRRHHTYTASALKKALPVDQVFVGHAAFIRSVNAISRVFELAGKTSMPQGLLLCGPPGTGKSSVVHYFVSSLPTKELFAPAYSVLEVRARRQGGANYMVSALLRKFDYPLRQGSPNTLDPRTNILMEALRQKKTRLIIVDQATNLIVGGRQAPNVKGDGTLATDFLVNLMKETSVGVVLVGTTRLHDLAQTDASLASLVPTREEMSNFSYDAEWVGFVTAFTRECAGLGFNMEFFLAGENHKALFDVTAGNPRMFKRFLTECALCMAQSGELTLVDAHAARAFSALFGSASPIKCPYGNPVQPSTG